MKILIDADACPVTDIAIKIASENKIRCILLCDTAHVMEKENAETVTVDKGADSADFRLVNLVEKGDIVITQDYGLAAMCLGRNARVLNQNGMVYNDGNIEELLYSRFVNKKIRMAGGRTAGPKKRTREQDEAFSASFRKLINMSDN